MPILSKIPSVDIHGSIESRNVAKENEPPRWTTSIVLRHNGRINTYGGAGSNTSVVTQARDEDRPVNVDHRPRKPTPLEDIKSDGLEDDIPC